MFDLSLRSGSYLWMIYNTYVNGQWGSEVDNILPFSEGDIFTFNIYVNGDEGNFLVICTQDVCNKRKKQGKEKKNNYINK